MFKHCVLFCNKITEDYIHKYKEECSTQNLLLGGFLPGADKFLARPGRKNLQWPILTFARHSKK